MNSLRFAMIGRPPCLIVLGLGVDLADPARNAADDRAARLNRTDCRGAGRAPVKPNDGRARCPLAEAMSKNGFRDGSDCPNRPWKDYDPTLFQCLTASVMSLVGTRKSSGTA